MRRMSRRRWSATWLRPCPRAGSRVRLRGIVDVLSSPTTQPTNGRPPPDPGRRLDRSGRLRWATVATAGTTMHHTALRARVEGGCTLSRPGRAKGARPAVLRAEGGGRPPRRSIQGFTLHAPPLRFRSTGRDGVGRGRSHSGGRATGGSICVVCCTGCCDLARRSLVSAGGWRCHRGV